LISRCADDSLRRQERERGGRGTNSGQQAPAKDHHAAHPNHVLASFAFLYLRDLNVAEGS
jgi:hypothetical protein